MRSSDGELPRWGDLFRISKRALRAITLSAVGYAAASHAFLLILFPEWHRVLPDTRLDHGARSQWLLSVFGFAAAVWLVAAGWVALREGRAWLASTAAVGALGPALGLLLHRAGELLWWPGMAFGLAAGQQYWPSSVTPEDPGWLPHYVGLWALSGVGAVLLGGLLRLGRWHHQRGGSGRQATGWPSVASDAAGPPAPTGARAAAGAPRNPAA
jgi:hypothetical protein